MADFRNLHTHTGILLLLFVGSGQLSLLPLTGMRNERKVLKAGHDFCKQRCPNTVAGVPIFIENQTSIGSGRFNNLSLKVANTGQSNCIEMDVL